MNSADERNALDLAPAPNSLLAHARRLLLAHPEGPLPFGGEPLPEKPDEEDGPPDGARDRAEAARALILHGTSRQAVLRGLELLKGAASAADVPMLKLIGLLEFASSATALLLQAIPGTAPDLIWLGDRVSGRHRVCIIQHLISNAEPAVRDWVLSTPRNLIQGELARKIAERCAISRRLAGLAVEPRLWDQTGNLLLAMASTSTYRCEIRRYEQAAADYWHWIALAARMPASLDRAALLTMVGQDVSTGPAAAVVGEDDAARMLAAVHAVLAAPQWQQAISRAAQSGDPVQVRRGRWVVDAMAAACAPVKRFAVRVVRSDPDPAAYPRVETRILIDGVPVIARYFDKGSAEEPEYLLGGGKLRAGPTPAEVRLAEAYCTEGCCGALYVTIVREGTEVVWKDWKDGRSPTPEDLPGEVRFDAVQYDREVARAEQDHGWEWPARTAARLISERLRAEPSILAQWDCRRGWCTGWGADFDSVRLTFMHPAEFVIDDPWLQFGLIIDVDGREPALVAAEVIASLRTQDPKLSAEMIGGSRDGAERLGLPYRKPSRWKC